MHRLRKTVRAIVPEEMISWYHWTQTMGGAIFYRFPSRQLIVIGATGSKGKTTTANLLWAALSASGAKVGATGTANLRIGKLEEPNKYHMTMLGRWYLQKYLRRMVDAGCRYAVIETPSEGQKHYRHAGINYDVLLFTNLTHEELPIHHGGSFEQLKRDNGRVFRKLHRLRRKNFHGRQIPKVIIVNNDAADAPYYAACTADRHASFSIHAPSDYKAIDLKTTPRGTSFFINEVEYQLPILGDFNVINAAGAIAAAAELDIPTEQIAHGIASLSLIPGRMEVIDEGQSYTVVVDYAHEQTGMKLLLDSAQKMKAKNAKVIVHLGAEGGGRDVKKRPEMGAIAAAADIEIIGNVDPYNDDPKHIIEDIAKGAEAAGKVRGHDLLLIEDRRAGIRKALELARKGDIVLITGKGAEQSIIINGKKSAWDDRQVVREELRKLRQSTSSK